MKRFLSLLATGALALGLSSSAMAQTRNIGAGGLVLDDYHHHTVLLTTPPYDAGPYTHPPTTAYDAWEEAGFPTLNWYTAIPPFANAQAGFLFPGPLSDTGALTAPYTLTYWLGPGQTGFNHSGGYAGAWDYATSAQLGIITESPAIPGNVIPKSDPVTAGTLVASILLDAGGTFQINTTTPVFTIDDATGNTAVFGTLTVTGLTTTNGALSNTGAFTTDGGAALINTASPYPTTIGSTGNGGGGNVTINSSGTNPITLDVGNPGNNLILNNIASSNVATANFLTLDPTNNVRTNTIDQFVQGANGVLVTYAGNIATAQLGASPTDVPFGSDRYINAAGNTLHITDNSTADFATFNGTTNAVGLDHLTNLTSGDNLSIGDAGNVNGEILHIYNYNVGVMNGSLRVSNGQFGVGGNFLVKNDGTTSITDLSGTALTINTGGDGGDNIDGNGWSVSGAGAASFSGITNGGTFTTDGGAATINTTTTYATTIGSTGTGGGVTLAASGSNPITLDVGVNTNNLVLNNIAASNVATANFLTLDPTNNVRTNTIAQFVQGDNGVLVTYSGGVATAQLGAANTDVPFTSDRFVNLDASNLNFTSNSGGLTPVQIVGGGTPSVNITAPVGMGTASANLSTGLTITEPFGGPSGLTIDNTDNVGSSLPELIRSNTTLATWGTSTGNTEGRMLRFDDQASNDLWDIGINQQQNWYLSRGGNGISGQTITATNAGQVGINNSAPGSTLDVGGTFNVSGTSTTNGVTNAGAFTTSGGAASINGGTDGNAIDIGDGIGANTIGIGNGNAAVTIAGATNINASINGATNINTGTSTSPVAIGSTGFGGGVTVASSGTNPITLDVGNTSNNLVLNHIASSNVATANFLTLDPTNNVRTNTIDQFIHGNDGVLVSDTSGVATASLGASNTDVPFTSDRYVNLDTHNLNFTSNGGATTAMQITPGARVGINTNTPTSTNGDNIAGLTINSDDPNATGTSGSGSEGHQLTIQTASCTNEELAVSYTHLTLPT